jgi:hypothetical protein
MAEMFGKACVIIVFAENYGRPLNRAMKKRKTMPAIVFSRA